MSIDLDAYLERIGYQGSRAPTLDVLNAISLAHTSAIPFENLDVLLERPIALDPVSLFDKLVRQRRGGYCFEQNGLLLLVLEALGFQATPISAQGALAAAAQRDAGADAHVHPRRDRRRVLARRRRHRRPVAHLGDPPEYRRAAAATPHDTRRIVREGGLLYHQVRFGQDWSDIYEFTLEAMPQIDRVLANWYTSAHPESHFKNRLVAALAVPDGRRSRYLDDEAHRSVRLMGRATCAGSGPQRSCSVCWTSTSA